MKIVKGLKYSKEHEWIRIEGSKAYAGITDYAQEALGDLVYMELPSLNTEIKKGDVLGVVDSVKAASEIYSPVTGTVIEVNEELESEPEKINSDPYESWIALIELHNMAEIDELMESDEYEKFCGEG